jgi:hypothetical protein
MAFGSISIDKIVNSDGFTLGGSGATMKNRIINGAMAFDQRNAGANTVPTSSGTYTLDRWSAVMFTGTSKYSVQQSNTAPTGFNTSLLVTSTTANTVGSGDYYLIQQPIEGNNIADLGWGTANAKPVTLSFYVRSSLTGTFGGTIVNHNYSRCYPFTYTINSADTFEQKTITISGDTSGTWQSNTAAGMLVNFSLGSGSTVSGTAGAWSGTLYTSATGATSLVSTNGATLYLTGVQLEVGSQATSFDYRQHGTELALCQRYFYLHSDSANKALGSSTCVSTTQVGGIVYFPVSMRASPTLYSTLSATDKFRVNSNVDSNSNNDMSLGDVGLSFAGYSVTGFSGFTTGYAGGIRRYNATGVLGFTAEL